MRYLGPGDAMPGNIWSHDAVFAAADQGVWFGTGEDYEIELVGWTGETIRRIRWEGPDLNVTPEDINRYRDSLEASYRQGGGADWRARFQRRWEWESEIVPDVFPPPWRERRSRDRLWGCDGPSRGATPRSSRVESNASCPTRSRPPPG